MRLVSCVALGLCALAPGLARAQTDGPPVEFNVSGELRGGLLADLEGSAGPVVFGQVILQATPSDEDVKDASPRERARPKAVLVLSNAGRRTAAVSFEVTFEDEAGVVLMTCAHHVNLAPGWNQLVHHSCNREDLLLRDWPRVRVLRLVGKVQE